jgi:hypothetical protein
MDELWDELLLPTQGEHEVSFGVFSFLSTTWNGGWTMISHNSH